METIDFLIEAKKACYAGGGPKIIPFRPNAKDLKYEKDNLLYYDTYVGGETFAGEEGLWKNEKPIWIMNYSGRLLKQNYNYDFLIEALQKVTKDSPFRGPKEYTKGDFTYKCNVEGNFSWFYGDEEIFYKDVKYYECLFHGGEIK